MTNNDAENNAKLAEDILSLICEEPESRISISWLKKCLSGAGWNGPKSGRRWRNLTSRNLTWNNKPASLEDVIVELGFKIEKTYVRGCLDAQHVTL